MKGEYRTSAFVYEWRGKKVQYLGKRNISISYAKGRDKFVVIWRQWDTKHIHSFKKYLLRSKSAQIVGLYKWNKEIKSKQHYKISFSSCNLHYKNWWIALGDKKYTLYYNGSKIKKFGVRDLWTPGAMNVSQKHELCCINWQTAPKYQWFNTMKTHFHSSKSRKTVNIQEVIQNSRHFRTPVF